jgi:outer membrane protein assembly factor BamB
MYQRDASHNAVVEGPLRPKWTWASDAQINGGVAVVGGRLYLDTFSKKVVALDVSTGAQLWVSGADNILMSTPVVENDTVIVGSGHNGRLNAPSMDSPYPYAGDSRPSAIWGRPEGDRIVAFDAGTGEKRWEFATAGEDMPSPVLVNGAAVFVNGDKHMYALEVADGALSWQQSVDGLGTMASSISVNGNAIASMCNDAPYRCQTVAVDPGSGHIRWTSPFGNSDSSPTSGDGLVFLSGLDNRTVSQRAGTAVVAALDAVSGLPRWKYRSARSGLFTELGSNERAIAGTYAGGTYYQAVPMTDEFIAFDAAQGRVRWVFHSTGPIKMSCVVKDGRVYVGDTAGLMYVLDASSGRQLAARAFRSPFSVSPPVIVGQSLIVANSSLVYAIPLDELGGSRRSLAAHSEM